MNVPARLPEGRVIRSSEEWREIVADFEREGGAAVDYCARRGLKAQTLLRWRRRHGSPSAEAELLTSVPEGGIWLATAPADMRKSFDGLAGLVRSRLGSDPVSGGWFVFVNRRRTMMKILGFGPGGCWIWSQRLEQGLFALLALQGILGTICMIFGTKAFSLADASQLAPISYVRLPLVALLAYWFFGEVADPTTWIGAAIIVGSTLAVLGGSRLNRFARFGHGS